ncbi:trypsin-like peptidase domain-containing protein [Streptomyces sp. NPDC098789]|uniref:trypsin-like peptidase domain-containing protein n=1 Tax=Streptomyces sp. NPDC098789 TaxID=3366098 RepID=UPI0038069ECC
MAFTGGTGGTAGSGGEDAEGAEGAAFGAADPEREVGLVGIFDPAGHPRGSGFVADDRGTVLTAHEAVEGLDRVLLRGAGERGRLAAADQVTLLPGTALALVRTDGLGVRPLPVAAREAVEPGAYVRLAARGWRQARVLGGAQVTYRAVADRVGDGGPWPVAAAVELAIGTDGRDALRLGGEVCGGPVLDAETGSVLAVVSTALQADQRCGTFVVPLHAAAAADPRGPLAELLARNAATVPGYGNDLNLAGALQLTGMTMGPAAPAPAVEAVERAGTVREFEAFLGSGRPVLGLVGEPGAGRTTELAALAARRARGCAPAPTVWLRGADLLATDGSVGEAVGRALSEAARIVAAPRIPTVDPELGERVAALAVRARRPLLVLLDAPEEMPPHLAHRLADWTAGTAAWLTRTGARLIVAGRPEHWERAGALYPPEALHTPGRPARRLPPALRLGDLTPDEAALARSRYGVPDDGVDPLAARHPLALRLLSDVRAAGVTSGRPSRNEIFAAHLDLMCLRVAVRVSASPLTTDPAPEAAGSSGPGSGGAALSSDPGERGGPDGVADTPGPEPEAEPSASGGAEYDAPGWWLPPAPEAPREGGGTDPGTDPGPEREPEPGAGRGPGGGAGVHGPGVRRLAARVGGRVHEAARRCLGPGQGQLDRASFEELFPWRTGWASAVLAEGLLVPAGPGGYRLAHEELSDWLQAAHLDVPTALDTLVHHPDVALGLPVPRHRIGPVLEALLLLPDPALTGVLTRLVEVLNLLAERGDEGIAGTDGDRGWWAGRLVRGALLRRYDVLPQLPVLHALAEHVSRAGPGEFGGWFWNRLRLPEADRLDLLRRLLPADPSPDPAPGPPGAGADRFLDAAARRLARDARSVQPLLCAWFGDERRLHGRPGATVATAAQALLHTHRRFAVDDLAEALVTAAHPRADELLSVLAEEEPSAVSRAVDRWAHDERPGRRVAAATYALAAAPHVRTPADRELLRFAAQAILARPADASLHGTALAILLRDPQERARHLPDALVCFRARSSRLPAAELVAALPVLPDQDAVFDALADRADGEVLRALAVLTTPALARRAAELVRAHLARRPEDAPHAAAFVHHRLAQGPCAGPVLRPLVLHLLDGPVGVRTALAEVLAAPGGEDAYALRDELVDVLLDTEADVRVLDALLGAVALGAAARPADRSRELLRRTGRGLLRAPGGAAVFDRRAVELARAVPAFGALAARWLAEAPAEAASLLGPSARRMIETLRPDSRVP